MGPRTRSSAVALAGALAAVALPLTGCTPFANDELTTTTSPTPSSSSPTAETGEGRQLTEAEATAALPTRPEDAEDVAPQSEPEGRTTDPAGCLDVMRIGAEAEDLRSVRVARAQRTWRTTDPATTYGFEIDSHSRPVGPTLLDRAGAAMADCSAFSLTGRDDAGPFDLRVLAEPRTVSTLGEQSYGARLVTFDQVDGKSVRVYLDYVVVRAGNNLVEVNSVHLDEDRGIAELETQAAQILEDLQVEN